jgi:hypothetical protein
MLALIDKSESQGRIQPFGRRSSSRVAARWSLSAAVRQKAVTQEAARWPVTLHGRHISSRSLSSLVEGM